MDKAKVKKIFRPVMGSQGAAGPAYETPSYTNAGGMGDRRAIITISATAGLMNDDTPGAVQALINGLMANEVWFNAQAAAGKEVTLDFGHLVVMEEIKWYQDIIQSQGTWVVKASTDNSTKIAVSSNVTLGSATAQVISTPGWLSTPYRYLHLTGVSGNTSSNNYTLELECKIGNPLP